MIRLPTGPASGEDPLPSWAHMAGALWGLFAKGTNPIHGGSTLTIHSPPKTPPPNTIALWG